MNSVFIFAGEISPDINAFESIVASDKSIVLSLKNGISKDNFSSGLGPQGYALVADTVCIEHQVDDPEIVVTEEWLTLLKNDARRFEETDIDIGLLNAQSKISENLSEHFFKNADSIICWGNCVIPALLYAQTRFVVCCTEETLPLLTEVSDTASLYRYSLRVAAAVVVFSDVIAKAVKTSIDVDVIVIGSSSFNALQEKLTSYSHSAITAFDSLKQKRCEITYEARYGNIYDAKYHNAVCYQIMDEYLVDIVQDALSSVGETEEKIRILDLGCGPGSMVDHLMRNHTWDYVGVDISQTMVDLAKQRYPDLCFQVGDAENLNFPDECFDLVLCSGMLHHFPNLENVIFEVRRVLKPGGYMVSREPNEDNFAFQYPKLGFLHLCLKNISHVYRGTTSIIEPEEHDYHTDFDFATMPEAFGKYLWVDKLYTNQKVSYFYDMLLGEQYRDLITNLEETLDGVAGLNIVAVAVKSGSKGVSLSVKEKIKSLSRADISSPREHLNAVINLYDRIIATNSVPQFELAKLKKGLLCEGFGIERAALIKSGVDAGLASKGAGLDFIDLEREPAFSELGIYDYIKVVCSDDISAGLLIRQLNRCKDYGVMELVIFPGVNIVDMTTTEKNYLLGLSILPNVNAAAFYDSFNFAYETDIGFFDGGKSYFLSRNLFTRRNFVEVFQQLVKNYRLGSDELIKNWISNTRKSIRREYKIKLGNGDFYEFINVQNG